MIAEAILKHLPPSTSRMTLLDVNGEARHHLPETGFDCIPVSGDASQWDIPANSVDAVVALDYILNDSFLTHALTALRAGGRMIIINQRGTRTEDIGRHLEQMGFVRILVEGTSNQQGVLIRGEKRHQHADTLARIATVAQQEADLFTLDTYKGRFLHLLILQTPNKPVWQLTTDEIISWQAVTVTDHDGIQALLAFSSLPKAVNFMQPAVLSGFITGINKVGKFRLEHAPSWGLSIRINPAQTIFEGGKVSLVDVDPTLAEAPNE